MASQFPNIISFKLDDYRLRQLENYCYDNGVSTSRAIRVAMDMMFLRQYRKTRSNTGNTDVDAIFAAFEK